MRNYLSVSSVPLALTMGGCATRIASNVYTDDDWSSQPTDRTYVIAPKQVKPLEIQHYEELLRAHLNQRGFQKAVNGVQPDVKEDLRFKTLRHSKFAFYDQFVGPPTSPNQHELVITSASRQSVSYARTIVITIWSGSAGRQLYRVVVHNVSDEISTPTLMPALIFSAFHRFPHGARRSARRRPDRERSPKPVIF